MRLKSTSYLLVLLHLFFVGHDLLPHGHIGDQEHSGTLLNIHVSGYDIASDSGRESDHEMFVHLAVQELKSDAQKIDYHSCNASLEFFSPAEMAAKKRGFPFFVFIHGVEYVRSTSGRAPPHA